MSHWNHPEPHPDNLAPEDIEFILQKTANDYINSDNPNDPYSIVGYDDYIGYGLLDAGAALALVHEPYRVAHFSSSESSSWFEATLVQQQAQLFLNEKYVRDDGVVFNKNSYMADVYRVSAGISYTFGNDETIVNLNEEMPGYWARHSSSNLFPPPQPAQFNTEITPHERVTIQSIGQGQAVMWGYAYKLYHNGNLLGWIPFDPTGAGLETRAKFALSLLLVKDPNGEADLASTKPVTVYPNPALDQITVRISSDRSNRLELAIRSIDGKIVAAPQNWSIKEGHNRKTIDVSHLPGGVYVLHCLIGQDSFNVKFIKL